MLASINLVNIPPIVSIPNDNGVTSNKRTSLTSPLKTPPWIAAPKATTSSGFTPLEGSLPKKAFTASTTAGILVEPPTKITSSISLLDNPAALRAVAQGLIERLIKESVICSNLALVRDLTKCLGIPSTGMIYGKLISVVPVEESSIFAFSAPSFNL